MASDLDGKIKVGKVNADEFRDIAKANNIEGFPTIKFFGAGIKSIDTSINYDGTRTSKEMTEWAI